MDEQFKSRMIVDVLGIRAWVRTLCVRADHGDQRAERALLKLQQALDLSKELCGDDETLNGDEYFALMEGLKILLEAACGHSSCSRNELRQIAERTVEDCRRLGVDPPPQESLSELLEGGN